MSPSRTLRFGLACLILGWAAAGCLEWADASLGTVVAVLIILAVVVAAAADHVTRSRDK